MSERGGAARPPVTVIVGATATGKTELAVLLAEGDDGEIVSLDSRQIYRGLDLGTAKPTHEQRARAPHHLIDIADPGEPLPLAAVQKLALDAVRDLRRRGRRAYLVGGTGQYVWSVVEGWQIPEVEPDPGLREALHREVEALGPAELHARLAAIDPAAAEKIHPHNVRRIIRALEVWHHTGEPISEIQRRGGPPWPVFVAGLRCSRPALYERIDARIERMLAAGLEAEVRRLVDSGLHFGLPALQSVGYREWRDHQEGRISREEVIAMIRRNTRRLVRMQETWFRRDDQRIRWYDAEADPERVAARVRGDVERWSADADRQRAR